MDQFGFPMATFAILAAFFLGQRMGVKRQDLAWREAIEAFFQGSLSSALRPLGFSVAVDQRYFAFSRSYDIMNAGTRIGGVTIQWFPTNLTPRIVTNIAGESHCSSVPLFSMSEEIKRFEARVREKFAVCPIE